MDFHPIELNKALSQPQVLPTRMFYKSGGYFQPNWHAGCDYLPTSPIRLRAVDRLRRADDVLVQSEGGFGSCSVNEFEGEIR
jgi:hypothetical protein